MDTMDNPFTNKWAWLLFDAAYKLHEAPRSAAYWWSPSVLTNDVLFNFFHRNLEPKTVTKGKNTVMDNLSVPHAIFMFLLLAEVFEHGDIEIS
jgi:hypothetical protein